MNLLWFLQSEDSTETASASLNEELKGPRWVLRVTALAFVCFLGWAYFSEIDQVARAPGVIIPSSKIQIIQSQDGGVLELLPVQAGDKVVRGQVVAQFNQTDVEADYLEAAAKVAGLSATMARLRAEIFGVEPVFSDSLLAYPHFVKSQRALFVKRQAAQGEEISALEGILLLVREEIEMNLPLVRQGDVSRTEILRLKRQEAELVAKITNTSNKYFQDVQAEYNQAEGELESVRQALVQRQRQLRQKTLKAPVAGIVKNVRVTTEGGVIRPGEVVMEIVPIGKDFVIEAKLSPADIGFVSVGQSVAVKVDAFDYTIYGDLAGTLSYISADTLAEQSPQGDVPYYRIHVRTNGKKFNGKSAENLQILPGMTTTVEIRTGKNTVLNYLLKPIAKTLVESMGER